MKVKTSTLTGPALDWAVAKCEGMAIEIRPAGACGRPLYVLAAEQGYTPWIWKPSTDWSQSGPIIEREKITVVWRSIVDEPNESYWVAEHDAPLAQAYGSTLLIAAMRCFVASQLGDTVDVPEELK